MHGKAFPGLSRALKMIVEFEGEDVTIRREFSCVVY
jgi:hypothetical protein